MSHNLRRVVGWTEFPQAKHPSIGQRDPNVVAGRAIHAPRRRDLAELGETRPRAAIAVINPSVSRFARSRCEFADDIEVVRRGTPNARCAASVDSASFGKDGIRPAAERLGGFVEFPYANTIRKLVVADGIPVKLPNRITDSPGSADFAKVELPAVEPPRTAVPQSPTPARHVVTLDWTEHRVCMNVLDEVFVDQVPVRTVESDNPAAVNNRMDIIQCPREFADLIGDRLSGQGLLGKVPPAVRGPENPAAIQHGVAR